MDGSSSYRESHEALAAAIQVNARDHAKVLSLSTSLIHKWTEPSTDYSDSGARNPLDRIEAIIANALHLGKSRQDALAPIYYLAERFGLITINLPNTYISNHKTLTQELINTIKEFGDLAGEASQALGDSVIEEDEVRKIKKEGWELIRQVALFMKLAEQAQKGRGVIK